MDEPDSLPAAHLTMDQLVAVNMRHWRRAAGMTQEELGARLGKTAANISAIEQSADPSRDARRFDAQALTELSLALCVPLAALFLPPEDDGEQVSYVFTAPDGEHGMEDLMDFVVMTDSADDRPVMEAYRHRFHTAVARYLDPAWLAEVGRWLQPREEDGLRAERAERLRAAALAIEAGAGELKSIADAIDPKRASR